MSDYECDDGNTVYNHCGMGPACDGDNLGEASVWSWCFLDEASKADPNCVTPAGGNWDYCELGLGLCTVNQFASGGSCHDCFPGTTRPAGDNPQVDSPTLDGHFVSTTCAVVTCPIDHHVVNHACVPCQAGETNPSGDFANGDDTTCEFQICGEHQYAIFNGACWDCPAGFTGKTGDPNSCEAIICEVDQRVVDRSCVDCPAGFTGKTGDPNSCEAVICEVDQRVVDRSCVDCPAGFTGKTGDPNSCEAVICEVDQRVVNKACVDCAAGYINPDRHSAAGDDTQCSAPVTDEDRQPDDTYCPTGYTDTPQRWGRGLGKITIVYNEQACSERCTQYSDAQWDGGCKGYMTGTYYGMLLCRSYGGRERKNCAPWANPSSGGACCTSIATVS